MMKIISNYPETMISYSRMISYSSMFPTIKVDKFMDICKELDTIIDAHGMLRVEMAISRNLRENFKNKQQ